MFPPPLLISGQLEAFQCKMRSHLRSDIFGSSDISTLLQLQDEEETHGCILNFLTMRKVYTHDELELILVQLGWEPLAKQGGWRRYFKGADATVPHGLATIAKLPARSFVDAPKHMVLDFVKTVNKRENRNVLCCWYVGFSTCLYASTYHFKHFLQSFWTYSLSSSQWL